MSDDDTYEVPLQDQRIFGAGLKRKRVKFIPTSESLCDQPPPATTTAQSVSNRYLQLVLPKEQSNRGERGMADASDGTEPQLSRAGPYPAKASTVSHTCEICHLPLSSAGLQTENNQDEGFAVSKESLPVSRHHDASLVHQICLEHSYPPSHLDRRRKGLAYLSSYGWDPDSRTGLGRLGQGIQFPIKTKPKDDKLGIGVVLPPESQRKKPSRRENLDAGKIRKMYDKDKKKAERLREMFYRADDVERYLGSG